MAETILYRLVDFGDLREEQGIYSWHAFINKAEMAQAYNKFFNQKKFEVKIKGNFKEEYVGEIESTTRISEQHFKESNVAFDQILEHVSQTISPPLYIGISGNIRSRLRKHLEQMDQASQVNHYYDIQGSGDYRTSSDTDEESAYFGGRIGQFIRKSPLITSGHLLAKVTYFDDPITWSNLIKMESLLNRTYFPIFGRN